MCFGAFGAAVWQCTVCEYTVRSVDPCGFRRYAAAMLQCSFPEGACENYTADSGSVVDGAHAHAAAAAVAHACADAAQQLRVQLKSDTGH